jgi:hypothetical protein
MSVVAPIATFRRCIGPTGSIDLTDMPVGIWPHKQKDRLAAVSQKSDQVF